MFNAIHITHEAVRTVGGIGAVLEGLINSRPYRDSVGRTVLFGPLPEREPPQLLGSDGCLEYSSRDQCFDTPYAASLRRIEQEHGMRLVYGQRRLADEPSSRRTTCEVLLVDPRGGHAHTVNWLKRQLWEHYGLESNRFEHLWDYEQYVRIAAPAGAALDALGLATDDAPAIVFAHEFMGVPTALALQAHDEPRYHTLFYAHEAAPVRRVVETLPGHDLLFYHALALGRKSERYLEEVFGPQDDYFKHALVRATHHCHGLLAVGHHVVHELQFLGPEFEQANITLAFNGIPVGRITPEQRRKARAGLQQYCENLLGWRPDLVFTHVTRLARSKALWRDLDVLEALDERLAERGQTAVMLVLSTDAPGRAPADILRMEREWDWPVLHREGPPDLTPAETPYYRLVQAFNARARQVRVVFVNQFGFDRERCGQRVPAGVALADLRRGTHAEFGLSLYEPFGIAPLEPLTYGAVCVVSTTCGCAGLVQQVTNRKDTRNVVLADYLGAVRRSRSLKDDLAIGADERRAMERRQASRIADALLERLPGDEAAEAALIRSGHSLAQQMSWDAVVERYVFPAILTAAASRRLRTLA